MSMPATPRPTEYTEALKAWQLRLCDWAGLDPTTVTTIDVVTNYASNGLTAIRWKSRGLKPQTPSRGIASAHGAIALPQDLDRDPDIEWTGHAHIFPRDERDLWAKVGQKPSPAPKSGFTMHLLPHVADPEAGPTMAELDAGIDLCPYVDTIDWPAPTRAAAPVTPTPPVTLFGRLVRRLTRRDTFTPHEHTRLCDPATGVCSDPDYEVEHRR